VYEFRFSRRSPKLPSYLSAPLFSDCGAKRRPLSADPLADAGNDQRHRGRFLNARAVIIKQLRQRCR
jgi:hypothetical protein